MAGEEDAHTANTQQAIILPPKLNLDANCQQTGREALCRDSTFLQHLTHWGGEGMVLAQSVRVLTAGCTGLSPRDTAWHSFQMSLREGAGVTEKIQLGLKRSGLP